ncbi:MAG: radical SAM protein [Chloroflexi bacterium]|nr:radical SAM protein [Chloroflexota bacterium]
MRYRRVLFVFPYYPSSVFAEGSYLDAGLGYLSEALNGKGIENSVLDMSLHRNKAYFLSRVREYHPDLIGISMRSLNFRSHYALATEIRQSCPEVHIVAGGPHVSTFREEVLQDCAAFDYGVVLEGEHAIVELCRDDLSLSEIPGLIYRGPNGQTLYTGDRPFNRELDSLAFPTYSRFELERYLSKLIPIVSSRGCPYQCIYCPVRTTIGRQYRARDPILVADEVEWWYRRGYRTFDFTDDNFTLIAERAFRFCEEIARRGLRGARFSCGNGIRADRVTRELLAKMKEVGFYQLSFGVESGNNRILKNLKKGETLEEIEQAIAWACELGFQVKLTFLIGSPGETWDDFQDSLRIARKYPVWKFNFFTLTPFPKTELHDSVEANNQWLIDPKDYLDQVNKWTNTPAFESPELSKQQRIRAYNEARKLMEAHWRRSERRIARTNFRESLRSRGIPSPVAGLAAAVRHSHLITVVDERLPWFGRALRALRSTGRQGVASPS